MTSAKPVSKKNAPTSRKKGRAQKKIDRLLIVSMIKRGMSHHEIAQEMKCTVQDVKNDVHKVLLELSQVREKDRELVTQQTLLQYGYVKQSAIQDYEVSKLPTQSLFDDGTGNAVVREVPTVGDQQALNTVLKVLQSERELMGMDYPKIKEVIDASVAQIQQKAIDELLPIIREAQKTMKALEDKGDNKSNSRDPSVTIPITHPAQSEPVAQSSEEQAFDLDAFLRNRMQKGDE